MKAFSFLKNEYYRYASGYSFLFFIAWSLWWSLYAIWLKGTIGLTGTQLGTLYSGSAWKTESMVTPVFATPILTISWLA